MTVSATEQSNVAGHRPDDDAVNRAKREIQAIVQQIAELSRSEVAPERFYDELLNKTVSALAAAGGAVWILAEGSGLQLAYQINLRQTGLADNPIGQEQHGRLLHRVLTTGEAKIVAPHSAPRAGPTATTSTPRPTRPTSCSCSPRCRTTKGCRGWSRCSSGPGRCPMCSGVTCGS